MFQRSWLLLLGGLFGAAVLSAGPATAQPAEEAELQEKIRKLETELADLRGRLERLRGKEPSEIVALLDRNLETLLNNDRKAAYIRQAAQEFNDKIGWGYRTAIETLRKHRSTAAVPLVLKYLISSSTENHGAWQAEEFAAALTILTGEDVSSEFAKATTPAIFAKNWWLARKDKITVDLNRMNRGQLERIVGALLTAAARGERDYGSGRGEFSTENLHNRSAGRSYDDRRQWYENEIHPAMLPILLARCGAESNDAKPAGQAIDFHAIAMLAQLRRNGEAAELDKIANDHQRPAAVRLTCLLANLAAGDDLPTETLLDLYRKEKNLEIRVLALLNLPSTTTPRKAAGLLLEALEDSNVHIRTAAVYAMASIPDPAALPKLAKMLAAAAPERGRGNSQSLLRAIRLLGSPAAKQVLAEHLEACLQKNDKSYAVSYALREFETITGQIWIEAGAHDLTYYHDRAAKALAWWKEQSKKVR